MSKVMYTSGYSYRVPEQDAPNPCIPGKLHDFTEGRREWYGYRCKHCAIQVAVWPS